ncbi:MAG: class I SAM-dependent methyltransferase [Thermoleophilia bacterium]|nr:class I SAM-dependent methyltransferase [Thermoleophilia bacterium]
MSDPSVLDPLHDPDGLLDDPLRTADIETMRASFPTTGTDWIPAGGSRAKRSLRVRAAVALQPLLQRVEQFHSATTRAALRQENDSRILEWRVKELEYAVRRLQRLTRPPAPADGPAGRAAASATPDASPSRADVATLAEAFAAGPVVDLECGDGALLARMRERGIAAIGVDASHEAAGRCAAEGFNAFGAAWPAVLADLRTASVAGIVVPAGFDLLPGRDRRRAAENVVRALRPGGVAVFERPQPRPPHAAVFDERASIAPETLAAALAEAGLVNAQIADDASRVRVERGAP